MASAGIRDVRKLFGSTPVIHGVDISIGDGEFFGSGRPVGLRADSALVRLFDRETGKRLNA